MYNTDAHTGKGIHNFAVCQTSRGTIAGLASWLLSVHVKAGNRYSTRHEMGTKLQEASSCAALHGIGVVSK